MKAPERYVVGQAICASCGEKSTHVAALDLQTKRKNITKTMACDACGAKAACCPVWYPADVWPEVVALVRFDRARQALNLPPLTDQPRH